MAGLNNLKADRIVKAFERTGWTVQGQRGSYIKLTKEGNQNILSIPIHKGRTIKKAGLTIQEFLKFYK